jgi:hypothetical protein
MIGATTLLMAVAFVGCAPEPQATTSDPPTASAPSSMTATPSPTATPVDEETALPDDCTKIYSAQMLSSLQQQNPPMNDPAVTMYATENAALLENFETLPTLRCSWGPAGDTGLATNVTIVDAAQSDAVKNELAAAGFGCGDENGATVCRIEQRGVSLDDVPYTRGEIHAVRGNLWISTAWLNFTPEGYTEDILATLRA